MLGKLLWFMVDGHPFLPREDYNEPEFDLTKTFPNDRNMQIINRILEKCLVKRPEDCIASAQQLLGIVDESLAVLERGLPMLNDLGQLAVPCRLCGKGYHREHMPGGYTQLQVLDAMNVMLARFGCEYLFVTFASIMNSLLQVSQMKP